MNRRPERLGDLLPGVLAQLAATHTATNGEPPMADGAHPAPAELLYRAASRVENPEERDPSWIHMAAAAGATAPLAAWLRTEAVFASSHHTVMKESVAFARTVLGETAA